ncbi:MAG: rhomboid family intramembrane serine protease [Spirochaetaceae bacterium]|jgi:membrane associated rhomboid family serine protease|nr:rhomboid family intramembrane serine protease [Spirochaetaceae bacterium]
MLKLKYNAPVILTFVILSTAIVALSATLVPSLIPAWFTVGPKGSFKFDSLHSYIILFSHVLGHSSWDHLAGNMLLILVIGPLLEEIYGASEMIFMIAVTAFVTGLANILFFSTGLLGASGVVFMLVLLASFTNFRKGEIPLTFILVLILYVGQEFLASFNKDGISHFAHIAGGFCGSLFGFFRDTPKKPT